MIIVVGVNSGKKVNGRPLKDGGCAIIKDGKILGAVSEERVTRKKRDGGSYHSIQYLMSSFGLTEKDVDLFVTSTCCEPEATHIDIDIADESQWTSCNHHKSHAIQAFYLSPFDEAIVIVLDSGGNLLSSATTMKWWEEPREQHTYYLASRSGGMQLMNRDFDKPFDCGIGEAYRAFTHFLGWNSSRFAGNTMALAACGDSSIYKAHNIFGFSKEGMTSALRNDPNNPVAMVQRLLSEFDIKVQPRQRGDTITSEHANLAAWIQYELEKALLELVNRLVDKTGIKNVCLSGGVAYNCKSIHRLQNESKAESIFVSPASGDHGQCLGNAIYGYMTLDQKVIQESDVPVYLGPNVDVDKSQVLSLINSLGLDLIVTDHPSEIIKIAATLLAKECVVGWYQGRSEFGPRALGNRSILASPAKRNVKNILNSIKGRDSFMPFAPAVLEGRYEEYFDKGATPYMTVAVWAKKTQEEWFKSVIHNDGSARVQVVKKSINEKFHDLIRAFYEITGIPMVLNTSLNGKGEPIVESIEDALLCFSKTKMDFLVIGDLVVSRRVAGSYSVLKSSYVNELQSSNVILSDLQTHLSSSFPNIELFFRDRFLLYDPFVELVKKGKKTTTIRYRKHGIDFPSNTILPLFPTFNFSHDHGEKIGLLKIEKFELKKYGDLTNEDAINDGFSDVEELQNTLKSIYGDIGRDELVSVYTIYPIWNT